MRKIREILRLHYECSLSNVQIGKSCGISGTAVGKCLERARSAKITWPTPKDLNDQQLAELLYQKPKLTRKDHSKLPSWDYVHKELKKKGVTRELLWQEYRQCDPDGVEYSRFCTMYRQWQKTSDPCLRQEHKAGEKTFVDYAGQTVPIYSCDGGPIKQAQIFIAVLGASNYTFAEASYSQSLPCWINSHIRAFEYFGGSTQIVVPDNLKSGVTKPCYYEPDINRTYLELAQHHGFAVIPARVRKPKDKAKAEGGVLLVERWILAVIRNEKFYSLDELNARIKGLLEKLNTKPFQNGSRRSLFEELDKPLLRPLPQTRFQYAEFKQAKVNIDYHVELDGHYYSVPHKHIGDRVEIRSTQNTIEILHDNIRIASHHRSYRKGKHTTQKEHMPKKHQKYIEWTPERLTSWAASIGPATKKVAETIMASRHHPQQGFRSCLGIMRLSNKFGNDRVELACKRALAIKSYSYRSIHSILKNNLEQSTLPQTSTPATTLKHTNIRGEQILN